jgi:hypothetical protein
MNMYSGCLFISCLSKDVVSVSNYVALDGIAINE